MKNKSMVSFQSWNMLLIFGATAVMFLVSPSQMQLVFSSNQSQDPSEGSQVPSTTLVPPIVPGNQEAVNHIDQAQSALQKGDTAGAQSHLDSAKKALLCEGCEP
jgi:hypothetical protein